MTNDRILILLDSSKFSDNIIGLKILNAKYPELSWGDKFEKITNDTFYFLAYLYMDDLHIVYKQHL